MSSTCQVAFEDDESVRAAIASMDLAHREEVERVKREMKKEMEREYQQQLYKRRYEQGAVVNATRGVGWRTSSRAMKQLWPCDQQERAFPPNPRSANNFRTGVE